MAQKEVSKLERKFLEYVLNEAKARNISQRQIAIRTLLEGRKTIKSAERALYAMMGSTASGTPQRITLCEAERMANLLGERLPYLLMRVQFLLDQELEKEDREHQRDNSLHILNQTPEQMH